MPEDGLQLQPDSKHHVLLHLNLGVPTKLPFIAENDGTILTHAVTCDDLEQVRMLLGKVGREPPVSKIG